MYVTVSHTTVLTPTVISITTASARRSPSGKWPLTRVIAVTETTKEVIIALISLHALIRHQYQRRMRTSPVPDPSARRNFQAPSMVWRFIVTMTEARNRKIVAQRETAT